MNIQVLDYSMNSANAIIIAKNSVLVKAEKPHSNYQQKEESVSLPR